MAPGSKESFFSAARKGFLSMKRGCEGVAGTLTFPCEQNIKAQLSYMTEQAKRAVRHISELLQLSQGHLGSHFGYKLGR